MHRKEYQLRLLSDEFFQQYIVKELEEKKPIIPQHDPSKDNTEDWKAQSAMLKGYLLACTILGVKL